jgi:AcrR family transcriptional regulator
MAVTATDDALTAGLGLRERKRLQAMRRIQSVALDLFDEHGFGAVTIERIAAAAEVSPSSVYRYFGTKEQLILWDEYDPAILQGVLEELHQHPPFEAVRRTVSALVGQLFEAEEPRVRRRTRYLMEEPSVQAASALQAQQMGELLAEVLATRAGRERDDLDVQVFAHGLIGAMLGGIHHWYRTGFASPFAEVMDEAFAHVQRGFDLD